MELISLFVAQLDRETEITRRALQNVPAGKDDWKPHPKSMQLGYLAFLTASMTSWIAMIVKQDEQDVAPKDKGESAAAQEAGKPHTSAELIVILEKSAADAKAALLGTSDMHLLTNWKLLAGGEVAQDRPRYVFIMDNFTHLAHHRAQLGVYLRLLGAPVASAYGPTADDAHF